MKIYAGDRILSPENGFHSPAKESYNQQNIL